MRNTICVAIGVLLLHAFLFAQHLEDSIQESEVSRVLSFLSSDMLKGRGNFTPELVQAGQFIADNFKEDGLQRFPGSLNFYQPFNATKIKTINRDDLIWNGKPLNQSRFFYLTSEMIPAQRNLSDFKIVEFDGIFNDSIYLAHWLDSSNTLIWLKGNQPGDWQALMERFHDPGFAPTGKILFVADPITPVSLSLSPNAQYRKNVLFNIVGVLPGKTRPDEIVVFSAHYDHLGSFRSNGDGIYNGANDNASGTTALLMLAKYFALKNDNARTIFFCAFAGEELGLLGSYFLASRLKADNVVTMINIEMVGKEKNEKENSFFVTGEEYSSLGKILRANLSGSRISIHADRDDKDLFERSDNFPFALKGIPAHSIMCSDDGDPCYHETCDEARDIDMANMTRIIRSIFLSTATIVGGQDTPTRIQSNKLNRPETDN